MKGNRTLSFLLLGYSYSVPSIPLIEYHFVLRHESGINLLTIQFQFPYTQVMSIERAILRRWERELLAEAERVSRLLAHVRAMLADTGSAESPTQLPTHRHRRSRTKPAADAAYQLLADSGRPLNRQDIYATLVRQGFKFAGKEPLRTFAAILSGDKRFKPIGGRGSWGLKEWNEGETTGDRRIPSSNDGAVPESTNGASLL